MGPQARMLTNIISRSYRQNCQNLQVPKSQYNLYLFSCFQESTTTSVLLLENSSTISSAFSLSLIMWVQANLQRPLIHDQVPTLMPVKIQFQQYISLKQVYTGQSVSDPDCLNYISKFKDHQQQLLWSKKNCQPSGHAKSSQQCESVSCLIPVL